MYLRAYIDQLWPWIVLYDMSGQQLLMEFAVSNAGFDISALIVGTSVCYRCVSACCNPVNSYSTGELN